VLTVNTPFGAHVAAMCPPQLILSSDAQRLHRTFLRGGVRAPFWLAAERRNAYRPWRMMSVLKRRRRFFRVEANRVRLAARKLCYV
jgi:hypothetical protein